MQSNVAIALPATARRVSRKTKTGPRAVKAPRAVKKKPPVIVVVGGGTALKSVRRSLKRLQIDVVCVPTVDAAKPAIGAQCRAVIAVTPNKPNQAAEIAKLCQSSDLPRAVPLFVIVDDEYSNRRAQTLYKAGVTAVFEWPHDILLLPAMLVEMFGCRPIKGNRKVDAALTRAINTRLRIGDLALGDKIDVRVAAGAVELTGQIPSYWMRERMEAVLMHVPGVTAVLTDELEVKAARRSDTELAKDARAAVRAVTDAHRGTVSVSARAGAVSLAGVVASHDEMERLHYIVGNVRGVCAINNLVTVSPRAAKRASLRAAALRRELSNSWPDADLRVSVFGSVAVLGGSVPTLATKRALARFAQGVAGIERVVNKTSVMVD